ncbi:MAG TPA: SH3 domain-containing protein [Niabella sp.]|nr:SH3 domain-containing protein [Niabella sp.]
MIIFLRSLLFLLSWFSIKTSQAQSRPYFIISTTQVYDMPGAKGNPVGVYARGGTVTEQKKLNNGWSEVLVENGEKAFVPSKFLATSLNAKDTYEKDPAAFVLPGDKDAEYGSPHLFVIAAGVKARAIFSADKPVAKILRTNEPYGVTYLPYDENKLVKIEGGIFDEDKASMLFTQRKFLGRKLNFDTVLQTFRNTKDPDQKKVFAERIYEMSWRANKAKNLQGVQIFRAFVKESGNTELYNQLAFEEFLLKATQEAGNNPSTPFEKGPIRFSVQNKMLPADFTEKDILAIPLSRKIITNSNDYPECGIEVTKEYQFDHFTVYHSNTDSLTYIPEIRFKNAEISVTIDGFTIDGNTTEEAFIRRLGKYIHYNWLHEPHVYYINGDGDVLTFTFKNGKAVLFSYWFYC